MNTSFFARVLANAEILIAATIFSLAASCSSVQPHQQFRGTVIECQGLRSLDGTIYYSITVEFRDDRDVLNHVTGTFPMISREAQQFGEVGRTVCLSPQYGRQLRLEPCTD